MSNQQRHHSQANHSQTESNMFLQNISSVNQTTMSSREMAQLCEKRHDHVCRDIDNLNANYISMGLPKVGEGYYTHPNTGSQKHREFLLTQEQCLDLVTGYRTDIRIRINRRWQELEAKAASPVVPQSLPEALRLAADLAERVEQQQAQLAIAEPKALVYDTIIERDTLLNATQVGSKIGLTAQKLNKLLSVANVYDKRIKRSKTFSSWFVEKGLGEMKQTASGYPQALFTTKGEAWVVENFGIEEA